MIRLITFSLLIYLALALGASSEPGDRYVQGDTLYESDDKCCSPPPPLCPPDCP